MLFISFIREADRTQDIETSEANSIRSLSRGLKKYLCPRVTEKNNNQILIIRNL